MCYFGYSSESDLVSKVLKERKMSWTEIGAFGELIGAIGFFVSITFVA